MSYLRTMGDDMTAVVSAGAAGVASGAVAGGSPVVAAPTYSSSTLCSDIPAGDPYRKPGNQCIANDRKTVMDFDQAGNVVPTATTPWFLLGVVAIGGLVLFGGGRRR